MDMSNEINHIDFKSANNKVDKAAVYRAVENLHTASI